MKMKRRIKQERAITLMALVITIIVLIILTMISIATLTGENGIIKKGEKAKEEAKKAEYEEILKTIILHYNMLIDEKGEYTAIREMRKHVAWYVKGMKNATIIRNEINTYETYDECEKFLRKIFM